VLWLEPILVVLCLFVYSERSASRGATILAAALAPLAAALSPEVGVPVGAGVFLAFAVGALREPESGGRTVVLLVFGGSAAIIVAALACFDMFVPFVRFMSTRASVMTELNARWTEQSAVHPFLLVRAFAVAAVATSWCRRGLTRADARVLLPGLLTMLVATFGIMADEPERQWRFVGLDLAGLALALRSGRRRYSFAAVALLLVFAGMFVRPTNLMQMLYHPRFRRGSTLGSSIVDRRLGPLELSVRERRRWYRLAERFDADEPYFNLSNYQLDYFLLDKPLPFPFIPLHVGSRPSHQRAVVDALHDAEPRSIVWRSAFHDLYWGVAPYALMFHLIDAHVLPAYAFDGTVGPCQVLRRERCATVRTYNDLLAPAARKPLPYGWAPFILGLEGERGIARLEPLLAGLPVERRWVWAATIRGDGAASLNIAPRGVRGDRPSSVTVEFLLKPGEHRYIIPIWNLAAWASEDPAEWLRFDASVPPTATVLHSGREALR